MHLKSSNRNSVGLLFGTLLLMSLIQQAFADQVTLINGDTLSGTLVKQEDGVLSFKSEYVGDVSIKWEHVREVHTDEPMQIKLYDQTTLSIRSIVIDGDQAITMPVNSDDPVRVNHADITDIQPESVARRTGWEKSGRVNFALKYERGNSDTDNLTADFDLRYRKDVNRFRFTGQWDNESVDGENTVKKWFLAGNYNHFVSKRWYYGASLKLEHDEFADLDERFTLGPFIGHQFYESEPLNLLLELGLMYVHEDFTTAPTNKYWGPSWHLLFDKYVVGNLQFYHEQTGLLNAENTDKWLWDSWTGFRVPLFGGFIGSAEVQVDYDSQPAAGTDTTNTTYRLKLGYQW